MPNLRRAVLIAYLTVLLSIAWIPVASAYIDPGSTSMVFQALIAFAMAAGLTMKMFWRRIRSFFGGTATEDESPKDDAKV